MFEKKIKSICHEIKDKTLSKYFLDHYIQKINELTPSLNYKRNKFFNIKKPEAPLKKTKDILHKRNKFTEIEFKEFSILFLIINNLEIFRKNVELISEVSFHKSNLNELKKVLIDHLLSEKSFDNKKLNVEDFEKQYQDVISLVNANAPIKDIVSKKNEDEIMIIFNEIIKEINKIDLRSKIDTLEEKVASNLDENLYSELLSLRNQLKSG